MSWDIFPYKMLKKFSYSFPNSFSYTCFFLQVSQFMVKFLNPWVLGTACLLNRSNFFLLPRRIRHCHGTAIEHPILPSLTCNTKSVITQNVYNYLSLAFHLYLSILVSTWQCSYHYSFDNCRLRTPVFFSLKSAWPATYSWPVFQYKFCCIIN